MMWYWPAAARCYSSQAIVFVATFAVAAVILFAPNSAHAQGMSGDEEALARVDLMLERIGGKDLWAGAKTLYIEERSYHPNTEGPITSTFWRDLEKPGEWTSLKGEGLDILYAWDAASGWLSRNGEVRDFSEDEMEERRYYWHREIYTLYHQLAKGERALTISTVGINGFSVANEEGDKIGEFHLTKTGDLFFWQQFGGEDPVAYVYGPKKDFGSVKFPDWGGSTDGNWRFYYVTLEHSSESVDQHVSLAKPKD